MGLDWIEEDMIEKYASHYLWASFALAQIYANESM